MIFLNDCDGVTIEASSDSTYAIVPSIEVPAKVSQSFAGENPIPHLKYVISRYTKSVSSLR